MLKDVEDKLKVLLECGFVFSITPRMVKMQKGEPPSNEVDYWIGGVFRQNPPAGFSCKNETDPFQALSEAILMACGNTGKE